MSKLYIPFKPDVIDEIASAFFLRDHNKEALVELVIHLSRGKYDPAKIQTLHMATGAGKTYVMVAFIEYLRRCGIRNVVIVTPGLIVQSKTVQNLSPATPKYIEGVGPNEAPRVFTPQTLHEWGRANLGDGTNVSSNVFVFNIQQLLGTTEEARGARKDNEVWGNVFEYFQDTEDLVVIADESHAYSTKAKAFRGALDDMNAAVVIGLSATVSTKENDSHEIVFSYPLYKAINDGHVKKPVLAFRRGGYPKPDDGGEELQLRDAKVLLNRKAKAYKDYIAEKSAESSTPVKQIQPVLMVICSDINHAAQVEKYLASPEMFNSADKILRIDSKTKDDEVIAKLNKLDQPESPIRAVVSVSMLKEGWDVKNVAVICSLRASASEVLTQQTMGRGLRLPFGELTGVDEVDQLDILSHTSFEKALKDEDILEQFDMAGVISPEQKEKAKKELTPEKVFVPVTPKPAAETTTPDTDPAPVVTPPTDIPGTTGDSTAAVTTVGVKDVEFDDKDYDEADKASSTELEEDNGPKEVTYTVNEKFKGVVFHFPTSRIEMVRSGGEFNPAKIEDSDLQVAALKVADSGTSIDRKLLTPKANKLLPQIVTAAKGEASQVEEKLVVDVILAELMKMQFLPRHSGEKGKKFAANLKGRVERFVELVPVKPWTEKSIGSAVGLLGTVVRDAMRKVSQARVPERALKPVELPVTRTITLPATEVIDRGESFEKWKFFFEYRRGLFPVAKFDAGSTEYAIADFLEASDEVTWWKRIYDEDDASFAYEFEGSLHSYQPDFVVFEAETKTYWVVEGKSSAEIDSAQVQAKAKAARETLNMTPGEVFWPDMRWRYLIVDEKNLKSSGGWDDLKRFA